MDVERVVASDELATMRRGENTPAALRTRILDSLAALAVHFHAWVGPLFGTTRANRLWTRGRGFWKTAESAHMV